MYLTDAYFTSPTNGWAVGETGKVLRTVDGGSNWTTEAIGTSKWLESVWFTDANTGYIIGRVDSLYKTTDGGNSWSRAPLPNQPGHSLFSLFFTTPSKAYAVGNAGTILHTSDAGATWTEQPNFFSGSNLALFDVFFANEQVGYVVGGFGQILKTTNGGVGISEWADMSTGGGLYPNPVTDNTPVHLQAGLKEAAEVTFFGMDGKAVYARTLPAGVREVSTQGLANGAYVMELRTTDGVQRHRLLVQR